MGRYIIETDRGKFEVVTEEPKESNSRLPPIGKTKNFGGGGMLDAISGVLEKGPLATAHEMFANNPGPIINSMPVAGMTVGGLIGGIPGTAIGGMAGEAGKQLFQRSLGIGTPPDTSTRSAIDIGTAGATGAAAEIGGLAVKPGLKFFGGIGKKAGEMLSGMEAQKIGRIAAEPATMLPPFLGGPKTVAAAGEAFGAAKNEAGLTIATTAERVLDRIGEAKRIANETINKLIKGEAILPKEALEAKRALDDVLPSLKKDKELFRQAVMWKKEFDNILTTQTDKFANASKEYARSLLRSDFVSFFPKNKDGSYSLMRSGVVNALNHFLGLPVGAGFIASAPVTIGVSAAASGIVSKGLQNPVFRRYMVAKIANALIDQVRNKE